MGQGDHDGADGPERSEPASAVCSRVHRNVALSRWLLRLSHPDPARDRVRPPLAPLFLAHFRASAVFHRCLATWRQNGQNERTSQKQRRIMVEESRRVGPGRSASACKYGYTCDGARTRACRPRSTRPFASSAAGEDPPPRLLLLLLLLLLLVVVRAAERGCEGLREAVNVEPCFLSLYSPVLAFSPPYTSISLRSFVLVRP